MEKTLDSFIDMLHENSDAEPVRTESGKTILLVKRLVEAIEQRVKSLVKEPGEGSIFAKEWKVSDMVESLQKIDPNGTKKLYEGKLHNAGYNLIVERKDIVPFKKLYGFQEEKKLVESESRRVAKIVQHLEKFKTDVVTYKIRKIDVKEAQDFFPQFEDEARGEKLFVFEDIEIGPHLDKWNDDLYIVIPRQSPVN